MRAYPALCAEKPRSARAQEPGLGPQARRLASVQEGVDRQNGPVGSPFCFFGEETDNLDDRYPDCSPDATKIIWARGNAYGENDIFYMDCVDNDDPPDGQFDDCDTSGKLNLTTSSFDDDIHPTFDLGGNYIAWTTDADGDFEVWRMDADGANKTQMTSNSYEDTDPNWGPGGI